jgi:hypothetical protein
MNNEGKIFRYKIEIPKQRNLSEDDLIIPFVLFMIFCYSKGFNLAGIYFRDISPGRTILS